MTNAEYAYAPDAVTDSAATPTRRGLGILALIFALVPAAVGVIFALIVLISSATDGTGWEALGWFLLGLVVVGTLGLTLGTTAIVLGILAVVKRRGRGAGIAAIVVGAVFAVLSIPGIGNLFFVY